MRADQRLIYMARNLLTALLLPVLYCTAADAGYMNDEEPVAAGFTQWNPAEGGNGHWYRYFSSDPMSWIDAQSYALSVRGHLATITSSEEQEFIKRLVPAQDFLWLGGYQNTSSPLYSEPAGGWEWVTGESWVYSNWHVSGPAPPEPNEGEPGQNVLTQHGNPVLSWRWNDDTGARNASYLVEISSPSSVVPEPGTFSIFAICSATVFMRCYRRKRSKEYPGQAKAH